MTTSWSTLRLHRPSEAVDVAEIGARAERARIGLRGIGVEPLKSEGIVEISKPKRGTLFAIFVGNVRTSYPRFDASANSGVVVSEPITIPSGVGLLFGERGTVVSIGQRGSMNHLYRGAMGCLGLATHPLVSDADVARGIKVRFQRAGRIPFCLFESRPGHLESFAESAGQVESNPTERAHIATESIVYFSARERLAGKEISYVVGPRRLRFSLYHSGSPFTLSRELVEFVSQLNVI
jgi:hypothetical protein